MLFVFFRKVEERIPRRFGRDAASIASTKTGSSAPETGALHIDRWRSLDMPAMTMVFQVKEPGMLRKVTPATR